MEQQATAPNHVPSKAERSREIIATLARHGLSAATGHPAAPQLRIACEELGTTFIKLGQTLSTRADLLPEAYRLALRKLTDDVPPVPYEAVAHIIRDGLGASPDKLFARFDRRPLGSASIGQVHAAKLHDGREVVVKLVKPGVEDLVDIDLQSMEDLAQQFSERWPILDEYGAVDLVEEFSDTRAIRQGNRRYARHDPLLQAAPAGAGRAAFQSAGHVRGAHRTDQSRLEHERVHLVAFGKDSLSAHRDQRIAGQYFAGNIRSTALDVAELSIDLARRADRVLSEIERGNLRVWTRVEDLDRALARFERAVETTNATLLASASIVGLAIVMLIYHPSGWGRWIGYAFWSVVAIAFLFSLRTVWAAFKKRNIH